MLFEKQHLKGSHYSWNMNDGKQIFTGQPSRRLFDRFNGDQVLFMINFFAGNASTFSVHDGQQLEDAIFNHLPMDAKSEMSVVSWIRDFTPAQEKKADDYSVTGSSN